MDRRTILALVSLIGILLVLHVLVAPGTSAAMLRVIAELTGTVPDDPQYGPYIGSDLITTVDYRRVNIPTIIGDELEVMRMIRQLGLSAAMQEVAADPAYQGRDGQCHGAAHILGYAAFDLLGTSALASCSTLCFSGCYHGALQRMALRVGSDTTGAVAELEQLCSTRETVFERLQCFHGAGHGFLLQANYQLVPALAQCRNLTAPGDVYECFMGVFMEHYVGEGSETRMSRTDLHYPCTQFGDDPHVQETCYRMQPTHFLDVYEQNFDQASEECLRAPISMRPACFKRLGQLSGVDTDDPPGKTEAFCATVPAAYMDECITGGLRQVINFNGIDPSGTAAFFCRKLVDADAKRICYEDYAAQLPDLFTDAVTRLSLCDLFEEPYRKTCQLVQE